VILITAPKGREDGEGTEDLALNVTKPGFLFLGYFKSIDKTKRILVDTHGHIPWHSFQNTSYA
jgi:hypothetical protein